VDTERGGPGGAEGAALIADADDVDLVRTLFREYAGSLGVDLGFQGFEEELATLPGGTTPCSSPPSPVSRQAASACVRSGTASAR
jgi:hypothetical protein